MRRLISLGADIFAVDTDKHTALMVAVQENFYPGVKLLLEVAKGTVASVFMDKKWFEMFTLAWFFAPFLIIILNVNDLCWKERRIIDMLLVYVKFVSAEFY